MKLFKFHRAVLAWCLSISLSLHLLVIYFLYAHPIFFSKSEKQAAFKPAPIQDLIPLDAQELLLKKMNLALQESFKDILTLAKLPKPVEDLAEHFEPKTEIPEATAMAASETINPPRKTRAKSRKLELSHINPAPIDPALGESEPQLFDYTLESHQSVELSDEIFAASQAPENSAILTEEFAAEELSLPPPPSIKLDEPIQKVMPSFQKPLAALPLNDLMDDSTENEATDRLLDFKEDPVSKPAISASNSVDFLREEWTRRPLAQQKVQDIEYYGVQELANQFEWEQNFEVEVSYDQIPEQDKYVFSLTLRPDFESDAENLKQNFYFLIDRSNSVEKFRFNGFKRAVQRALSALKEEDHFNIYVFDQKVTRLNEKPLPVNAKNIQRAEEFLDRQEYRTFFTSSDLYGTLEKLVTSDFASSNVALDELHSIILVSDGNSLLSPSKQKKAISKLLKKTEGNLIFYTAAAGRGNNLVLLDLLSYTTSGKLLYSDTHAAFPRKLVKLMQDLHAPIIKNVSIEAVAQDSRQELALYPSTLFMPPLYANKPYVIVGVTDQLHDFTLYIQGKNRDKWLNIKKTVTFKEAKKGGRTLEKLWATMQSNFCYDRFLKDGKSVELKEAKKILAPYKGTICME